MEQKTVEQIAEIYNSCTPHEGLGSAIFMDGYTAAQQSQPMWREIEADVYYLLTVVRAGANLSYQSGLGHNLIRLGYTHYLSSEDLLKLPTLTKTNPQERG